jgi:hypothetical protein
MSQAQEVLNKVIDGILTVNVLQGRKDTMRIVPEMFYWYNKETQQSIFLKGLWEYFANNENARIGTDQSSEELGALGQAYFIPTKLLF